MSTPTPPSKPSMPPTAPSMPPTPPPGGEGSSPRKKVAPPSGATPEARRDFVRSRLVDQKAADPPKQHLSQETIQECVQIIQEQLRTAIDAQEQPIDKIFFSEEESDPQIPMALTEFITKCASIGVDLTGGDMAAFVNLFSANDAAGTEVIDVVRFMSQLQLWPVPIGQLIRDAIIHQCNSQGIRDMNELCAIFMMEDQTMDEHGEVSYAHAITTLESFGIQEDEAITEFLAHFTIDEDEDEDEEAAGGVDDEWTAAQIEALQQAVKDHPDSIERNERWRQIAAQVGDGKSKKDCHHKFKEMKKAKKSAKEKDGEGGKKAPRVSMSELLQYLRLWPEEGDDETDEDLERLQVQEARELQHTRRAILRSCHEKDFDTAHAICGAVVGTNRLEEAQATGDPASAEDEDDKGAVHISWPELSASLKGLGLDLEDEIVLRALGRFRVDEEDEEDEEDDHEDELSRDRSAWSIDVKAFLSHLQLWPGSYERAKFHSIGSHLQDCMLEATEVEAAEGDTGLHVLTLKFCPLADDDGKVLPVPFATLKDLLEGVGVEVNDDVRWFLSHFVVDDGKTPAASAPKEEGEDGLGDETPMDAQAMLQSLHLYFPRAAKAMRDALVKTASAKSFEDASYIWTFFATPAEGKASDEEDPGELLPLPLATLTKTMKELGVEWDEESATVVKEFEIAGPDGGILVDVAGLLQFLQLIDVDDDDDDEEELDGADAAQDLFRRAALDLRAGIVAGAGERDIDMPAGLVALFTAEAEAGAEAVAEAGASAPLPMAAVVRACEKLGIDMQAGGLALWVLHQFTPGGAGMGGSKALGSPQDVPDSSDVAVHIVELLEYLQLAGTEPPVDEDETE